MRFSASESCQATVTPLSDSSRPDIAVRRTASFGRRCRWSMLSCRLRAPVEALCRRNFGMDCFAPLRGARNDERNERKCRRRNADRRKALLPWHRPRPRPSTERRTSIGVPPRVSPQGVFHRKGLSLRPGFLGRGGTRFAYPLSGRYPPRPVPKSSVPHAPRAVSVPVTTTFRLSLSDIQRDVLP